jgi:hypothetical protein
VRGFRVSRGPGSTTACPSKPRGELCEDPKCAVSVDRLCGSIPNADSRTIFTLALGDGSADSEKKMLFKHTSANPLFDHLSTEQLDGLTVGLTSDLTLPDADEGCPSASSQGAAQSEACDILDWLRGRDVSGYREREHKLGDIFGSAPLVVGPPRQMFTESDYRTFRLNTDRAKPSCTWVPTTACCTPSMRTPQTSLNSSLMCRQLCTTILQTSRNRATAEGSLQKPPSSMVNSACRTPSSPCRPTRVPAILLRPSLLRAAGGRF